jgi:hypothetical protein
MRSSASAIIESFKGFRGLGGFQKAGLLQKTKEKSLKFMQSRAIGEWGITKAQAEKVSSPHW